MNMIVQTIMERLRPFVGSKGWDYIVLWKLSEDQRFVEWMSCCCGGAENSQNSDGDHEELLFTVSSLLPCRDTMFQHPRTNSCELLSQLPTSMPLDSGIYAQTLISNQPSWLNSSSVTCSHFLEESVGTRVLIPLPGGLIELFVNKQISEDQNVIDIITSQYNMISLDDHLDDSSMMNNNNNNTSFIVNIDNNPMSSESHQFIVNNNNNSEVDKINFVDPTTNNHLIPPALSPATALEGLNLSSYDINIEYTSESRTRNDALFFDGSENNNNNETQNMAAMHYMETVASEPIKEQAIVGNNEKDSNNGNNKQDRSGRSNSQSDCSDQVDDEDDGKRTRKSGKGHQCKNLVAERRRRKKLNERLYTLRSLVPKISKLDRASILGDAIEYVKDLKRQEKELQDELEDHSESIIDGINVKRINNNIVPSEILFGPKSDHHDNSPVDNFSFEASGGKNPSMLKQNHDSDAVANDKAPQMEPQVEVAQIDGNEFYVKVFCEHKPGRFVRLMEALNSLALEVTNANVTTFRNLVSNVLKVEKKDSKMVVQADHLRDFLLELTRNPSRGLSENGSINDHNHHLHHHHHTY